MTTNDKSLTPVFHPSYDEFNRSEDRAILAFEVRTESDNWLPYCVAQPPKGRVKATYHCDCGFQTASRREIWDHCYANHEATA